MLQQSEATLLLAEKRTPTPKGFRNQAGKCTWTDTMLVGGDSTEIHLEEGNSLVLIPFIGDLKLNERHILEEDQAFVSSEPGTYQICNPYVSEGVNFFVFQIQDSRLAPVGYTTALPLCQKANQWHSLCQGISVGQWDARVNATYVTQQPNLDLLVFVIWGAFEVQNRLLHPRDSLLLTQTSWIEFEALSPSAILMAIEL